MPMISNISSSLDTGMGSPGTPKNEKMEKIKKTDRLHVNTPAPSSLKLG